MVSQTIIDTQIPELLPKVKKFRAEGYRLVQICATRLPETLELQYSFDKDFHFVSLRITIPHQGAEIPSISGIYFNSFHYENEMHDLFGVKVVGIAVDYKGTFYRTSVTTPFNPPPTAGSTPVGVSPSTPEGKKS